MFLSIVGNSFQDATESRDRVFSICWPSLVRRDKSVGYFVAERSRPVVRVVVNSDKLIATGAEGMSELYPVLILKGLGWLLMARFTPHSRADVAQMWPITSWRRQVSHAQFLMLICQYRRLPSEAECGCLVRCFSQLDRFWRSTGDPRP